MLVRVNENYDMFYVIFDKCFFCLLKNVYKWNVFLIKEKDIENKF